MGPKGEGARRIIGSIFVVTAACGVVATRADAQTPEELAKAVVACQRAIDAAGAKFVLKKLGRLGKCSGAVFACVQQHPVPGSAERTACLQKAQGTCAKQLAGLTDPTKGDEAKARAAIVKTCDPAKVPFDAVLTVIGFEDTQAACADLGFPLGSIEDVAQCVVRRHECEAEELFARQVPRASELLALGGVDITPFACLPTSPGSETGLLDKSEAKAAIACQKTIQKAGAKFLQKRLAQLGKCAIDIFKCEQVRPGDPQCLEKAGSKCARSTRKVQDTVKGEAAKLTRAVAKACGEEKIEFEDVLSEDGLGFGTASAQARAASAEGTCGVLTDAGELGACLEEQHDASAVAVFADAFPTGGDVLDEACRQAVRAGDIAAAADLCAATAAIDPTLLRPRLLAATANGVAVVSASATARELATLFGAVLTGSATNVCEVSLTHPGTIPPGAPTLGVLQSALETEGLPLIEDALARLAAIPPEATIPFDLADLPPCVRASSPRLVEIDQGDILAARALFELFAGAIHAAAAYDVDTDLAGLVNGTTTFEAMFTGDPQLLTLRLPSGPQDLASARSFFADAGTHLLEALDFIGAELDDQSDDVLVLDPADAADVARIRDVTERLLTALTGQAVFEAAVFPELTTDQRLTLVPLFDGAVPSLRPFAPGFEADGDPDPCQFPDPTFGGHAPDGTDEELDRLLCPPTPEPVPTFTPGGPTFTPITLPTRTATPVGPNPTQTPGAGTPVVTSTGGTPSAGGTLTPTPIGSGPIVTPTPVDGNLCPTKLTIEGQGAQADLDIGYTGLAFDRGVVEKGTISVAVDCPGESHPNCGNCTVSGPIVSTTVVNNERCSTDPSIKCTNGTPESACSGSCQFFFGAPLALSAGGVGVCVTNQVVGQITGTANPDTGAGVLTTLLASRVHTALDNFKPCPVCSGAGFNETGTCDEGPRAGLPCTVHGTSVDFGNTSLDCPPNPGANVSGVNGLQIALNPTTGTSALQPGTGATGCVSDPFNGKACYCAGQKKPNECTTGICVADATGEGTCENGDPTELFCSNQDFRYCNQDTDCVSGGTCTIIKPRKCSGQTDASFNITGPLTRTGTPSTTNPVLVSTFCIPAVSAAGVNAAYGLPGPGALKLPSKTCYDDSCTFEGPSACPSAAMTLMMTATPGSDLDLGWTGIAHDGSMPEQLTTTMNLDCVGAECTVDGTALTGTRFGPPTPISSGGVPICLVNTFREAVTGTYDCTTGCAEVDFSLLSEVFLVQDIARPCPTCVGDPTPNDGQKGGTCDGGTTPGAACDVGGISVIFGATSNDCLPTGSSVGELTLDLSPFTTSTVTATSGENCLGVPETCVCPSQNRPNACDDGVCALGGICEAGPLDGVCSAQRFRACRADAGTADCEDVFPGAGTCEEVLRQCFPDTIVRTGLCEPQHPTLAALFCVPPTRAPAINTTAGLPGPGALTLPVDVVLTPR